MPPPCGNISTQMELSNVGMDQLKARYKRCHEQIAIIRDLMLKTVSSLENLETDNNFLRERNEFLHQKKTGQVKNEEFHKNPSKTQTPSAAKRRVELSLTTLGRIQEKLSEFEKVALSLRSALEESKEQDRKTRAQLEDVQRNFERERKRNGQLQEAIISMKNRSKREATSTDVAKRRLHLLAKELHGLTLGLSVQKCNSQTGNSPKKTRDDSYNTSASVEMVPLPIKSSTPNVTIDGSITQAAESSNNALKRRLATTWDFWYYFRKGFPEPALAQEKTWSKWKTVYSYLGSIITVYLIYTSVSSILSCTLKIFF